jgi:hypothetical protein
MSQYSGSFRLIQRNPATVKPVSQICMKILSIEDEIVIDLVPPDPHQLLVRFTMKYFQMLELIPMSCMD